MIERYVKVLIFQQDAPMQELSKEHLDIILYGSPDKIHYRLKSSSGRIHEKTEYHEGLITNLDKKIYRNHSDWIRGWIENFMTESECPVCHGARLNPQALSVKVGAKNMND
jgi:excinuclease ABC subunit A